jgi:hypothetical protein
MKKILMLPSLRSQRSFSLPLLSSTAVTRLIIDRTGPRVGSPCARTALRVLIQIRAASAHAAVLPNGPRGAVDFGGPEPAATTMSYLGALPATPPAAAVRVFLAVSSHSPTRYSRSLHCALWVRGEGGPGSGRRQVVLRRCSSADEPGVAGDGGPSRLHCLAFASKIPSFCLGNGGRNGVVELAG